MTTGAAIRSSPTTVERATTASCISRAAWHSQGRMDLSLDFGAWGFACRLWQQPFPRGRNGHPPNPARVVSDDLPRPDERDIVAEQAPYGELRHPCATRSRGSRCGRAGAETWVLAAGGQPRRFPDYRRAPEPHRHRRQPRHHRRDGGRLALAPTPARLPLWAATSAFEYRSKQRATPNV